MEKERAGAEMHNYILSVNRLYPSLKLIELKGARLQFSFSMAEHCQTVVNARPFIGPFPLR